jgi:hypothetical protein
LNPRAKGGLVDLTFAGSETVVGDGKMMRCSGGLTFLFASGRDDLGTRELYKPKSHLPTKFMPSLTKGKSLIKNLTPEQISIALAEWCLVRGGFILDADVKITINWSQVDNRLAGARIEVEAV